MINVEVFFDKTGEHLKRVNIHKFRISFTLNVHCTFNVLQRAKLYLRNILYYCRSQRDTAEGINWKKPSFFSRRLIWLQHPFQNTFFTSILVFLHLCSRHSLSMPADGKDRSGIILFYTYSRVSVPSSELAPPSLSSASECVPFWNQGGGGQHSLEGEGAGEPIRKTGEKAWYSVYSVEGMIRI